MRFAKRASPRPRLRYSRPNPCADPAGPPKCADRPLRRFICGQDICVSAQFVKHSCNSRLETTPFRCVNSAFPLSDAKNVLLSVPAQMGIWGAKMNTVKTRLLGTAAGLVAVAGAQAADMPVKAAPVQYVKICSLYGDGFYYIPGTDICLKVGGYVRGEYAWNAGASQTNGPFQGGAAQQGYKDRFDGEDWNMRTRAYAWFDSRQQTEYGTLRTYLQLGVNYDSPQVTATTFNANRAFIQFAGFTIGTAQSFFDFYSSPASAYWGALASDTGDGGWKVFAYTLQFGNGISTTWSI